MDIYYNQTGVILETVSTQLNVTVTKLFQPSTYKATV